MDVNSVRMDRWARIRERGALRFVLLYGMLGWGLGTAALFLLVMWLSHLGDVQPRILIVLAVFPVGGIVWGVVIWWISNLAWHSRRIDS